MVKIRVISKEEAEAKLADNNWQSLGDLLGSEGDPHKWRRIQSTSSGDGSGSRITGRTTLADAARIARRKD